MLQQGSVCNNRVLCVSHGSKCYNMVVSVTIQYCVFQQGIECYNMVVCYNMCVTYETQ